MAAGVAILIIALAFGSFYFPELRTLWRPPESNLRLDQYVGTTVDLQGVEPYVTVSVDRTIHVAWIGLNFSKSATYFDEGPRFLTQIWYARSVDGGKTFSKPVAASPLGSNFDPSIAVTRDGDVYISYLQIGGDIVVAKKTNQNDFFRQLTGVSNPGGHRFDRPWIAASNGGAIYLVWFEFPNVFWTVSTDDGSTFSSPVQVALDQPIDRRMWLPTGVLLDDNDAMHLMMLGWSLGSMKPDQVWYARRLSDSKAFQVQKLVSVLVPYGLSYVERSTFHPGPAIAAERNKVVVVYASDNGRSMYGVQSLDGGITWESPSLLRSSTGIMEMPWLTIMNQTAFVAWRENSSGFWNVYYAGYSVEAVLAPVRVSDQNGYPGDVLSWHGDFLGIASLGASAVIVVWSDGRGLPNNYGFGHIYAQIAKP